MDSAKYNGILESLEHPSINLDTCYRCEHSYTLQGYLFCMDKGEYKEFDDTCKDFQFARMLL